MHARQNTRPCRVNACAARTSLLLLLLAPASHADQLLMRNGDRYQGKVLSLSSNTVLFQSPVLGRLTVPRNEVASISFLEAATNQAPQAVTSAITNPAPSLDSALKQLRVNTNSIAQVRNELLATAGPEANQKFDQLLNGLLTGKLTLADIRAEAATAADQLRELKKDLGDDTAGNLLDGYLGILDNFLRQIPAPANPPGSSTTNTKPQATTAR